MFYTLHLGACYSKWMAGMFQTWKSLKQGWKWKCRRMIRDQPWWLRSWSWKMKVGMYHGRCKMIKDKRSQRKRCRKKCNKPSWCWKKRVVPMSFDNHQSSKQQAHPPSCFWSSWWRAECQCGGAMIEQICATKKSGLVDVYGALPCLSLSHLNGSVLFVSLLRCTFQIACVRYSQIFPGDSSCKPTCSRTPPFFLVRFDLHSKESALALNFSLFWRTFLKYLLKLKMLESDCHKCTWCGVWIFFLGGQFEIQRDASVLRSVDFIFSAGGCEKSSQLHDCQRLRCTPGQKKIYNLIYLPWKYCNNSASKPNFFY